MAITSRLWPEAPLATGSCPCRGRPASVAACGPSSRPLGSRAPLWGAEMGKACLEQVSIGLMQMFQAKLKVSGSLSSRNSFSRKRKVEPLVWSCTKEQGGVDRPVLWPLPFLSAGLRPWGGDSASPASGLHRESQARQPSPQQLSPSRCARGHASISLQDRVKLS